MTQGSDVQQQRMATQGSDAHPVTSDAELQRTATGTSTCTALGVSDSAPHCADAVKRSNSRDLDSKASLGASHSWETVLDKYPVGKAVQKRARLLPESLGAPEALLLPASSCAPLAKRPAVASYGHHPYSRHASGAGVTLAHDPQSQCLSANHRRFLIRGKDPFAYGRRAHAKPPQAAHEFAEIDGVRVHRRCSVCKTMFYPHADTPKARYCVRCERLRWPGRKRGLRVEHLRRAAHALKKNISDEDFLNYAWLLAVQRGELQPEGTATTTTAPEPSFRLHGLHAARPAGEPRVRTVPANPSAAQKAVSPPSPAARASTPVGSGPPTTDPGRSSATGRSSASERANGSKQAAGTSGGVSHGCQEESKQLRASPDEASAEPSAEPSVDQSAEQGQTWQGASSGSEAEADDLAPAVPLTEAQIAAMLEGRALPDAD